uniref:Oleoyl-[acyl-carrier-protein] hydrolase n=2 Tax=Caenorhabditis tropicalis TaxID=1561998 RepID=A0A1I7T3B3_9PELO
MNVKREIRKIKKVCLPFIHFGKIRISVKLDKESESIRVELFNLFGSLFGFLFISDENSQDDYENEFMTDQMLKKNIVSNESDSEEEEEEEMKIKGNQIIEFNNNLKLQKPHSNTLSFLISILRNEMNILKTSESHVATTPLPYLGIDSLRLAELEFRISNSPEFRNCCFKAPYLIPYKTLDQISQFLDEKLNENQLKTEESCEMKSEEPFKYSKDDKKQFNIPLSSQQKRILFVMELENEQLKTEKLHTISQFDEPILLQFPEFQSSEIIRILNSLLLIHSIFRTEYRESSQYLLSGTECFIDLKKKDENVIHESKFSNIRCYLRNESQLQIIFNHISIDAKSLSIFHRQFKNMLASSEISRPSLQYYDYCRCISEPNSSSVSFWKQYLNNGNIEIEKIQTDFSNDSNVFTSSNIHKSFPFSLQKKMKSLCLQLSFSHFELFFGVLESSIRRVLGSSGVFGMGFAIDQRTFPYFETIGCFTNVLLYLSDNSEEIDLLKRLKQCQKTLKELRIHGDVSYETIAKIYGINEDLFQVFVVSEEVDSISQTTEKKKRKVRFEDESICVEVIKNSEEERKVSKYPMTWYLRQYNNDELCIEVEYSQELFRRETIDFIMDEIFKTINSLSSVPIENFPKSPDLRSKISELSPLRRSDFPKCTVVQIINSCPQGARIRYLDKDSKITPTYLSSHLLKNHIQIYCQLLNEHPLILNIPRSKDLIESVIGAWNAGFFPVPLHNDIQRDQIEKICLQMKEFFILKNLDSFKSIRVNSNRKIWNRFTSFDIAYVTSTSGSTGNPKLVGTAFEGHSNLAKQYTTSFQISSKDTIGQVVDPSFDIFFADIVKTFTNGARLLLSRDSIPTSSELSECTNIYLMPAFLTRLSDVGSLRNLETLQYGGESLAPQVLKKIQKENKNLKVFQEFGLTEQTVYSSRRRISLGSDVSDETRIIGIPYDNIHFKIKSFSNTKESVKRGELILKGIGLMRGYFGVTKKSLKEFPTGDEVSKRKNGNIYLIGRRDLSVKIRGHRVDLFEVNLSFYE